MTQEYMQYAVAALLMFALADAVVLRNLFAEGIAANINALNSLRADGRVELTQEGDFDVRILHYDPSVIGIEQAKNTWKELTGDVTFGERGYYVLVTPYRNGARQSSRSFIIAYPREETAGLATFFGNVSTVCVFKREGRAGVELC
jgi:hypothetical protein